MGERRFPLLLGQGHRAELLAAGCPRDVPWSMLAPCEADCLRNHDQTVERLAERGGLDPWELMAVVQGKRWREVAQVPMPDVVEWLKAASGEETDISVLRQQLAAVTAERDGHLEELTHVRGRAIRAEAERDVLTAAVQELVARVGDLERLQDLWAEADAVANARALEVVEERDQLRAMLEECLDAMTARDTCFVCSASMHAHLREHCEDCVPNDYDHDPQHFNTVACKQWERILVSARALLAATDRGAK